MHVHVHEHVQVSSCTYTRMVCVRVGALARTLDFGSPHDAVSPRPEGRVDAESDRWLALAGTTVTYANNGGGHGRESVGTRPKPTAAACPRQNARGLICRSST